jgi:hypothetical protein
MQTFGSVDSFDDRNPDYPFLLYFAPVFYLAAQGFIYDAISLVKLIFHGFVSLVLAFIWI